MMRPAASSHSRKGLARISICRDQTSVLEVSLSCRLQCTEEVSFVSERVY